MYPGRAVSKERFGHKNQHTSTPAPAHATPNSDIHINFHIHSHTHSHSHTQPQPHTYSHTHKHASATYNRLGRHVRGMWHTCAGTTCMPLALAWPVAAKAASTSAADDVAAADPLLPCVWVIGLAAGLPVACASLALWLSRHVVPVDEATPHIHTHTHTATHTHTPRHQLWYVHTCPMLKRKSWCTQQPLARTPNATQQGRTRRNARPMTSHQAGVWHRSWHQVVQWMRREIARDAGMPTPCGVAGTFAKTRWTGKRWRCPLAVRRVLSMVCRT